MNPQPADPLAFEWGHLQRSFSAYERDALAIKLAAVAMFLVALVLSLDMTVQVQITGEGGGTQVSRDTRLWWVLSRR